MISSCCCASGRTAIEPPRRAAQGFADHLNSVLNATVTDSRLSLIPLPHADSAFQLTRLVGTTSRPLELHGSPLRLFVRQILEVVDGHCQTESYGYRLQADDSIESWLIRWEYFRDPPKPDYQYPRAHVHVNAQFPDNPIDSASVASQSAVLELKRIRRAPHDRLIARTASGGARALPRTHPPKRPA